MKQPVWLRRLFSFLFVFSALACGATPMSSLPQTYIDFAPDNSAGVTPDSLKEARRVLQKRLDYIFPGEASVSVRSETLRVKLVRFENPETAVWLATQNGEFVMGSAPMLPPERGSAIPPDMEAILTDRDIAGAEAKSNISGWMVLITFSEEGTQILADYSNSHTGQYVVIGHDGIVLSSPVIVEPILGGQFYIEGDFDEQEARLLAAQLAVGRLPFGLKLIEIK
jgi:preprotein translocase subunit SecD